MNSASAGSPYRAGPVQVLPFGAPGAEALVRLAGSLGLAVARIDLGGCRDKDELLGRIAVGLALPEWFGRNWDALYDCLADLDPGGGAGYLLVLEHAGELRREAPEDFDTAVGILSDVSAEWSRRGLPFRAFVDA